MATAAFTEIRIGGKRYYVTPYGKLPSVTTILKATESAESKARLEKWKANEPDADQIASDARERGTALHAAIEHYLRTGEQGTGRWWNSIWPFLQGVDRDKPHRIEQGVASPAGYAGCLDLEASLHGEDCIFDWKTSLKKKRPEYVLDYKLQVAAYAAAVNMERLRTGKPLISRGVVVVSYETALADVFHMNRSELIATYKVFLERLRAYEKL